MHTRAIQSGLPVAPGGGHDAAIPPAAAAGLSLQDTLTWRDDRSRMFFDLSPAALAITSYEGRILAVNPAMEQTLGFSQEEARTLSSASLYPVPEARARMLAALERDGKVRGFEVALRRKTGELRDMILNVDWITLDGERVLFTSLQDISERKRVEDRLHLMGHILDNAPGSITVHDRDGRFLYANKKTFKIHGYTPEEFMALNLHQLDVPASEALIEARMREIAEKGEAVFEVAHFRKDGSAFPLEVFVKPVTWNGIPAMLSIALDITERKQVEQALKDARDAAEAASRAKSYFLANMSHEIRTPMNAIVGFTGLALESARTPEQRRHLEIVASRSEDLLVLINDILDLSKIEAERLVLEPQRSRLAEALNDVIRMFSLAAENKGVRLALDLSAGLGDAVYGDARRLRQVLVNLVGNAVKFTECGSVTLRVKPDPTAAAAPSALPLHIMVEDTGPGIPADQRELIFDPFTQGRHTAGGKHGGTGLGLAICRGLVRMMGGRIWCESEPGRGSVFHVTLCLARQPTESGESESAAVVAAPLPAGRVFRILVVEDDRDSRNLALEVLRLKGHEATAVSNGLEALERLAVSDFDVVLMDVKMPGMDGLETTRRIRDPASAVRDHAIPVIAMTAFAMKGDEEECLRAGMDGYLSKPVMAPALLAAIDRVMGARPAPRPAA